MYNMWPESVPFRDCADLNFSAYLDKIKDPIALDVIKERLDEENPDQYSCVRDFVADLRKMFRNCLTFNLKESAIYKHAKKLEEKLDQLLQVYNGVLHLINYSNVMSRFGHLNSIKIHWLTTFRMSPPQILKPMKRIPQTRRRQK